MPSGTPASRELAQRLLDAHTAFQAQQLRGAGLRRLVEEEVDHALEAARRLTLNDVVDAEQVTAVAIKYVAQFRLPGAIPELAGDIALRVREHPANEVLVADVLTARHTQAAIAKVLEMQAVRERLADGLADNESVRWWLTEFLHGLASDAVASNRRTAERVPGVGRVLSLGERVAGGAVREADRLSREVAERAARGILHRWRDAMAAEMDEDTVATVVDVWTELSDRSITTVLEAVADDDLVDLVAIAYDFWLELRENPYLHSLIRAGVDYVFDVYGEFTLDALLTEFGLDRGDLVEEAMRFAPRVVAALDRHGELEAIVRRRLAPFYDDAATLDLLTAATAPRAPKPHRD